MITTTLLHSETVHIDPYQRVGGRDIPDLHSLLGGIRILTDEFGLFFGFAGRFRNVIRLCIPMQEDSATLEPLSPQLIK